MGDGVEFYAPAPGWTGSNAGPIVVVMRRL